MESIFLFLTFFCFLFNNPCYSETDTLHQGKQLKDWDELISSNRVFSLKFFSFGTMVSPYLGIFYNNEIRPRHSDHYQKKVSDEFSNMAVWVANRNNPVLDVYGKLIIDDTGNFSILSSGGTVHDLFSPTELVARNASVTLLDSGNLVLQELHPDGSVKRVLWQSFDHPTDTLLPGMKLGINLKTGQRWSLTSWQNDELPAEGLFKLVGDFNGAGQMVILRKGNVHWTSGPLQNNEFRNTHLHTFGPDVRLYYVSNETEQSFTYLTRTYDSYPALRMHQDGQLKGSPLNLNLQCLSIDDPPGCAEDVFEKIKCRKDHQFGSTRDDYYSFVDEYVYNESYNLYDCQRICWSNCSCVAYITTRNSVGCKTYGKKIYNPKQPCAVRKMGKNTEKKKSKAWIGLIIMMVPLVVLLACYWVYKNIEFKGLHLGSGYMPPEYPIDGIISTKIDVYGFGVLLLEIISSKMNYASYDAEHPLNLLGLRFGVDGSGCGRKNRQVGKWI
ncbi:hypothetical protein L1987_30512 [Smallanthus sonchifolius]|uniref:Uncharacterized protein n=1 Tax=Smallanthus sonchifolius TaxID=185202 RepID=A0ACB9I314_9ASTR|nr:hypothetical protein L1987_30512 [Smallanthus sonchifolius]